MRDGNELDATSLSSDVDPCYAIDATISVMARGEEPPEATRDRKAFAADITRRLDSHGNPRAEEQCPQFGRKGGIYDIPEHFDLA